MQEKGGLCEHLQGHDAGVVGNAFDGVVHKERMVIGGQGALCGETHAFLQGQHLVHEGETRRVRHRRSHFGRQFERRFSEGGKPVHQAQRTAAQNPAFAASEGFINEDRHAVFNRKGLDARSRKHRLDGPASGHANVAPAGPTDGDGSAVMGRRQASHFCIQHRVGRRIIGLAAVAKPPCNAGKATRKRRCVAAGSLHCGEQGLPAVDLDPDNPVKHIVALVGHQFGILETCAVNNTRDGAPQTLAQGFKRRTVHHVNGVIGGVVTRLFDGVQGEVHVSASSEPLPCTVPFDHRDLAAFACIDEALPKGVLLFTELLVRPINPCCR